MKPHESPEWIKNQFVAIRAIRGLCGIGVLRDFVRTSIDSLRHNIVSHKHTGAGTMVSLY